MTILIGKPTYNVLFLVYMHSSHNLELSGRFVGV